MLQKDATCNDRHKMINEEVRNLLMTHDIYMSLQPGELTTSLSMCYNQRGQCAKDEITFYTTPYGLGATVDCTIQPLLDHSLNDDVWTLQEIVVKTPVRESLLSIILK